MDVSAFSSDYETARARFRRAAQQGACELESIHLPGDRAGKQMTIDVAVAGSPSCSRALVISSGLHGVEGFLGSAVQIAALDPVAGIKFRPEDVRLVFIHSLNPFGFRALRRVDENNVDLNRNFILSGEQYCGAADYYNEIEPLLNLSGPPKIFDLYFARLAYGFLRYGQAQMKDAIAGGQYEDEKGLFFGGHRPSPTQSLLEDHLARWIGEATEVLHLDFHTGLGRWGTYKLILDYPTDSPDFERLTEEFGEDILEPSEPVNAISYHKRGGLGPWCQQLLPHASYHLLVAEFGTYPGAISLWALRKENQSHWHRHPSSFRYKLAKRILKEVFAPASLRWRKRAIDQSLSLVGKAIQVCQQSAQMITAL